MDTVQKFKLRKIVKALLGTLLKKGWDWFKNSNQVAAIAESPAVMTASGWTIDPKTGKAKQDSFNTPERNKLADNLSIIGEAGATAPTLVGDVGGLYNVVRHPVLTYNTIKKGLSKIPLFSLEMKLTKILEPDNNIFIGARKGILDAKKYYSSDKYIQHLKNTGLSEKEAKELQLFKIKNMEKSSLHFNNTNPTAYGNTGVTAEGKVEVGINPMNTNTEDLARETVWHEMGGHASSKGHRLKLKDLISPREYHNIYANPWYRKISEHNSQLIPELNPAWKAFMKGDMKTFNKLATKEDLEFIKNFENPEGFINYINDEQEVAARAISANIGDYVGKKSQWNLPQLEQFFTPDGIKKLRDNVWSVGSGLGGILFINEDWAVPLKKKGGKINYGVPTISVAGTSYVGATK